MTGEVYDDHASAILDLLDGNDVLAGRVYDGKAPDPTPPPPYVVAYFDFSSPVGADGDSLSGPSTTLTTRATLHCVGATASAARAMSARCRDALLGVRPTIDGWNCGLFVLDTALPPTSDETTGVHVMDAVTVFRLTSYPA